MLNLDENGGLNLGFLVWDLPWSKDQAHPLKISLVPRPLMGDQNDMIEVKCV